MYLKDIKELRPRKLELLYLAHFVAWFNCVNDNTDFKDANCLIVLLNVSFSLTLYDCRKMLLIFFWCY